MAITAWPAVTNGLPTKQDKMQMFSCPEPIHLPPRFAALKESLASGREVALTSSWNRLLHAIRGEARAVSNQGSKAIPTINFADISKAKHAGTFQHELRQRGVGIIRNVVPRSTALEWEEGIGCSLSQNPTTKASPAKDPQLYETYWSLPQVQARAHPNVLEAQRFAMGIWASKDPSSPISTSFPITYADRVRIRIPTFENITPSAHIDGGSVERWEPDGYGSSNTYKHIFDGHWEHYDPWESSTRLSVTSDLYRGAGSCSIFRAFQGLLATSPTSKPLQVCPMLRLTTAYFLLRPFFGPSSSSSSLDNWTLSQPQSSILHGALPSYTQAINPALHPHLQLDKTLVNIDHLDPGDYVIWHPDLIHVMDHPHTSPRPSVAMYLPACPLTQTNALYLARQRQMFLLGHPGPDFAGGRGESDYQGRLGVQDVNDAGGDDGLRAMGLFPFDEEEAESEAERRVLSMANAILFPYLYDSVRQRRGSDGKFGF
ncbi:hypothetical protein OQA88_3950 [Cercophora sp. LCS_1]